MRRPEFRLRTEFAGEGDARVVRKIPDDEESRVFLRTSLIREELAERFFGDRGRVVRGTLVGDAAEYPFLPHPSLEDEIEQATRVGDWDRATETVHRYVAFLESLPSAELVPSTFLDCVGAPEGRYRCFELGPADCIPRNILIAPDGSWDLIDHEWMMGFPVPVDWVLYRGISSLVYGMQDAIQCNVDRTHPVAIFAGRRDRLYAPIPWLEVMDQRALRLDLLEDWYFGWQQQILLNPIRRPLRPERHTFTQVPGRAHPRALLSDLKSVVRAKLRGRRKRIAPALPPKVLISEES